MTSKLVVNTIEADTGISSVSFASSISMNSSAKFHFSAAGIDIGADTNINRPASGVLGFNINSSERLRITSAGILELERGSAADQAIDIKTTATSGASRIRFVESGTSQGELTYSHDNDQLELVARSGQSIAMFTNGNNERLRIVSGGSVNIGGQYTNTAHALAVTKSNGNCIVIGNSSGSGAGSHDAQIVATDGSNFNNLKIGGHETKVFANVSGGTGYAETWRFNSSGNLKCMISGKGIDFSAASGSASGSSSALLDDYEEGTWTATLSGNSSPANTVTNNPTTTRAVTGTYRKIGSLVHVQALWTNLQYNGSNDMHNHQLQHITGIPFTSGNASGTSVFTAPLGYSRGIYGRYNQSIIEECVMYFWMGTASTTVYLMASQIVQNQPGTLYHTVSNSSSSMYYAFNMTYHTN